MHGSAAVVILVADLVGHADCLQLLDALCLLSDVNVDVLASIEDEAIALVHGSNVEINLTNANVLLSLDLEQALLASGVDFSFLEARCDSAGQVTDARLEVVQEERALVILNLAMLNGSAVELVVELHSEDGGSASLILCRLQAQPEVDIPRQLLVLALDCL